MDIRNAITTRSLKSIPASVWYLAVVLALMTGVSFALQSSQSLKAVNKIIRLNIEDVSSTIGEYGKSTTTIRLESGEQAVAKAHALAYMIELKPSIIGDTQELERIRKLLDVDEIHVSNKNGIIVGSTIGSSLGYDMASSPQSKEFMLAIYYKDFELAQKPQPKGVDQTLFQYAGVARLDQPGIVQVGFKPERLERVMQTADISKVAREWRIGAKGQAMIADFDGRLLSTFDGKHLGQGLTAYGFPEKAFNGSEGEFTATVKGQSSLFMYRFVDKFLVIASVPEDEIYSERNTNFLIMLLFSVLALSGAAALASRRRSVGYQEEVK
ncbi:MAG: hypothetical protein HGB02_08410 [Chlorobiaceae bacterium]|nr:hypothetical protein [Chlorobiaceae bacterium]